MHIQDCGFEWESFISEIAATLVRRVVTEHECYECR